MSGNKWKSGAPNSWWAIVPKNFDGFYEPLPWFMAATREGAWGRWRTRLPRADARQYEAVKVMMEVVS